MSRDPHLSIILILTRRRLRLIPIDPLHQTIRTLRITTTPRIPIPIPLILALVESETRTQLGAVRKGGLAFGAVPTVVVHGLQAGCHIGGPGGVCSPVGHGAGLVGAACCAGVGSTGPTRRVDNHNWCHMDTTTSTTTSTGDGAGEEKGGE